jgi:four helix bundle protein
MNSDSHVKTQAPGNRESGIGNREIVKEDLAHFTDLESWKLARQLCNMIYMLTKSLPPSERFGLISQLQRASVSVMSNISEGFGRYHSDDKKKFYITARASCVEVECQLIISNDQGFITNEELKKAIALCRQTQKTINGLIRSMNNRSH